MASNGKSNVPNAITANQKRIASRLFAGTEEEGRLEYVPGAGKNFPNASTATPDVPTASKMDSTYGGKNSMSYLKWIVRQVYSYALLAFGALVITAIAIAIFAGISFGWQLGITLAAWAFGS